MNRWLLLLVGTLFFTALATVRAATPPAAFILVTTTDDVTANDGLCSLREAVTAANTDSPGGGAAGECPAGEGADFIQLPGGTYPLTVTAHDNTNAAGDLDILSDISILTTAPATITLACPDTCLQDRLLHVHSTGSLAIYDVTLYQGRAFGGADVQPVPPPGDDGGAILSYGSLIAARVRFVDNRAGDGNYDSDTNHFPSQGGNGGAISIRDGIFSISDSVFINNRAGNGILDTKDHATQGGHGGALYQWFQTSGTVTRTTFHANQAGNSPFIGSGSNHGGAGGALFINGILSITASTLSENSTGSGQIGGHGGAIFVGANGDLTLLSSTLSGNRTAADSPVNGNGGGLFLAKVGAESAAATIRHSTIAHNYTPLNSAAGGDGGGLYVQLFDFGITLSNTIIANNQVGSGATGADCFGPLGSEGYLFLETTESCAVTGSTGNIFGQDPALLPLADNGGPTHTHALAGNSPALDAGNCPATTVDQRGEPRPVDLPTLPNPADGCDMGAYEAATLPSTPTPTPTVIIPDTPTSTATPVIPTFTATGAPPTFTATGTVLPPTATATSTAPALPKLYLPVVQRN